MHQSVERKVKDEKRESSWRNAHAIAGVMPSMFLRRLLFGRVHRKLGGAFEMFAVGSAPLEKKVAISWERMGIQVIEGYGASETTGFVALNTREDNVLGTVGRIVPGVKKKLTGSGELMVAGDNIVSGYFNNKEKTDEAFENGWFHTGDIVRFDGTGRLQITGREKFKIVLPDGKKVYPEDVEKKLNNHPLVRDAVAVGKPTDEGEVVHAELIVDHPKKMNKIIDEVNKQLNNHEQILSYHVWQGDDFPRTKSLKIDRKNVLEEVMQKRSASLSDTNKENGNHDTLTTILRAIVGKKHTRILSKDLHFDSLKRIELLALIEEEMGVSVDEEKITSKTTVSDMRSLIESGTPASVGDGEKLARWQFTDTMDRVRVALQNSIAFPLFNIPIKLTVTNRHNIDRIVTPQLFIFNHCGIYDVVHILRCLPDEIRKKTAIAATSEFWHRGVKDWFFPSVFGNAFPFVKAEVHRSMRGNFDRVGHLLDRGYNVMISPEGNITHTGKLLPFHTGAGYIAVEMNVPVTPFKINGLYDLWPEITDRKLNLYWPKKFGTVEVIIGEPITFEDGTSYEDATQTLRNALIQL